MYKLSAHNIIAPVEGTGKHIIINILSGNADILSTEEMKALEEAPQSGKYPQEFIEKGYVVDPDEEYQRYQIEYINFLEEREKEEIQIFFVPTYACNFVCSYCYQSGYENPKEQLSRSVVDAFFSFINQKFANRKKYITLFGGEPLLKSEKYKDSIAWFIKKAKQHSIDISVVTNGYYLDEYLHLLEAGSVREIQITLDGVGEVHNVRRRLKANNKPTFQTIVDNIDACLEKGLTVNLRSVIDRDNLYRLHELAQFAIQKGWTENPLFKTQLGRNYELHYCQDGKSKLFDRITLYQELYKWIEKYPEIIRYHKPSFSVMKFLQENGELPRPLFDACPACKSEWAMDYTGSIYSCTATVGKPGERLGAFYPEVSLDQQKINHWQQRDVMHIEQCKKCDVQLVCGGGCGSIAFNQNRNLLSPDCRPIKELSGLGAKAYFLSDSLLNK